MCLKNINSLIISISNNCMNFIINSSSSLFGIILNLTHISTDEYFLVTTTI